MGEHGAHLDLEIHQGNKVSLNFNLASGSQILGSGTLKGSAIHYLWPLPETGFYSTTGGTHGSGGLVIDEDELRGYQVAKNVGLEPDALPSWKEQVFTRAEQTNLT